MKRLLIIDDDPNLLKSLCIVFEGLYQVAAALSRERTLALMQQQAPDVVLLDLVMPGVNGVDFLQTLQRQYPQIPVVVISGVSSIRTVVNALETGAADFIRKPFDITELRIVIARALHTAELERELQQYKQQSQAGNQPFRGPPDALPLKQAVEDFERKLIQRALSDSGGINTRAAEMLGTTRRILQYRIQKLGIAGASTNSA